MQPSFGRGQLVARGLHADGPGEVMLTCTFVIILITVLFNGGGCAMLIERLQLKAPAAGRSRRWSAARHGIVWRQIRICSRGQSMVASVQSVPVWLWVLLT